MANEAKRLRAERLKAGLSTAEAARLCDISRRAWIYYEAGERVPRPPMYRYFIQVLQSRAQRAHNPPIA